MIPLSSHETMADLSPQQWIHPTMVKPCPDRTRSDRLLTALTDIGHKRTLLPPEAIKESHRRRTRLQDTAPVAQELPLVK